MKRKLNTTLGFYSPSFMRMHVGSKKSLQKLNILNDDFTESVYLHEFTHFIQDVSTANGLMNICRIVDYMKFVNNDVIAAAPGSFVVPVLAAPLAPDNVDLNLEISGIYNGGGEENDAVLSHHYPDHVTVQTINGPINVDTVVIEYSTSDGRVDQFEFGTLCIVESMAYIIESICYPLCDPSPELPYHSAEKLVDLIYPAFGTNRLNILALCDASLQLFNPGPFFYEMLVKIRDNKISFSDPKKVYDFCKANTPNLTGFSNATDFNSLLKICANEAINQLKGYFNDPYFQPIIDWLENMIRMAVDFRLTNESFPIDIALSGKINVNKPFADFLKQVGSPLTTNDLGETTLHDPNAKAPVLNYPLIWAIDQIHGIFWGDQRHCELVGTCCSGGISTDMRCTNAPWDRVNDANLCPFANIWRHWGLSGYYPA